MLHRLETAKSNAAASDKTPVVYVVDDDESIRLSMHSLIRSVRLRVETFETPDEFLAFARYDAPSCLVLDVRLPETNGLTFQAKAAQFGVRMPILFITGHGDIEMTVRAMKAGAVNFLQKPFREQDLLDAVAEALNRDAIRRDAESSLAAVSLSFESLTERERDVMKRVVEGALNKQIAYEMNLSEVTIKVYRGQVMRKMGSRNLPDLVRKAEALSLGSHTVRERADSMRRSPAREPSVSNSSIERESRQH
ncbi:response regulator [Caballeronia sp. GAFFF1]|uniref:response regulator transcription factor n=1 Tax=Caballeronia sp. GAFFF1 TaxID=2921779 RepID=UPI002027FF07|nr:response regulator [Caballeronia sp. GAFFF1]